jgi:DNA mismatch endonuclease (patch repair protein)
MADTVTKEKRSVIMSKIRGKETSIEVLVRKWLFSKGFRYRKNDKRLPGSPDIVLPKYKTAIFVQGCFWHGHEGCKHYKIPKTRTEFWSAKITRNIDRDRINFSKLKELGWNVFVIWECELRKNPEVRLEQLVIELKNAKQ